MRISHSLSVAGLFSLALACSSSSGGDGSSNCRDISGTWLRTGSMECSDGSSEPPSTEPVTIVQDGCSVIWVKGGKTHSGKMSGATLSMKEGDVSCAITFSGNTYLQKCTSTEGGQVLSCTSSGSRSDGGGGSGGSGGACAAPGDACGVNGDCCDFFSGNALCVDTGSAQVCAATCTTGSDCKSGCCAALTDGSGACAPVEFCQ